MFTFSSGIMTTVAQSSITPGSSYSSLILADNPFLYWRLGETSGTTAMDASPNARTGVYNNVILGVPGSIYTDSNSAISINGGGNRVYSSQSFSAPSVFTIGIRFRTSSVSVGLIEFAGATTTSGSFAPAISLNSQGGIVFYTFNGAVITLVSPSAYNDNNWHSVVARLSPAGMFLFVDGVLVNSNTNTTTASFTGFWNVGYTNFGGGLSFTGQLDEFFINSSALSNTTIASYHNAP